MKHFHSMTFKIVSLAVVGVLLTTLAIIISVILSEKDVGRIILRNKVQIEEQNATTLKTIARLVYDKVSTYDNLLNEKLRVSLFYMHERLQANGGFNRITGMEMNFEAKISSPVVDDVMRSYNAYSTIFRRLGDGTMVRVSTNITDQYGKRLVNTRITPKNEDGSPNLMMQTVLSGKTYRGRANVLGEWVNAIYEPVIENGNVVGMLFVSSTGKDSRDFIENLRNTNHGYVFAVGVDGVGKGVMTMSMEKSMRNQNQNVSGLKNSKGEYYWQQVMDFCSNLPKDSVGYIEINYKNESEIEYELALAGIYYPEWNWAMGIAIPKEDLEKAGLEMQKSLNNSMDTLMNNTYFAGIIMVIAIIIISFIYTKSLTKPLKKIVNTLKKGETGDIQVRSGIKQKGEIGSVAKNVDYFFEEMQNILKKIHTNSNNIAETSKEFISISEQVSIDAKSTSVHSDSVASEMEHISTNIDEIASNAEKASVHASKVATAAEQMSANMNKIATAIEDMGASINQIASNTTEVSNVATEATEKATSATNVMNELGAAAKEIGQVTDVIKRIADKTNLLALNATIEAASAGEAGKGFAVVAGEIKELANQSAKSADDIAHRIENIQNDTNNAVKVIHDVSDIIVKIGRSVETITSYVVQQTKASNEITDSVTQATVGSKYVANAISEVASGTSNVSSGANEVTKSVIQIKDSVVEVSNDARSSLESILKVNQRAGYLGKISEDLKQIVSRFKI